MQSLNPVVYSELKRLAKESGTSVQEIRRRTWSTGTQAGRIPRGQGSRVHSSRPEGMEEFSSLSHSLKFDKAWISESRSRVRHAWTLRATCRLKRRAGNSLRRDSLSVSSGPRH